MPAMTIPADGGCRCGRVRFRLSAAPLLTMACHCRGCQRMTASAYSTSIAIPADGFALLQGETEPGGCHAPGQDHQHCGWCKSWLFTRLPPELGFINVRATMLDEPGWYAPFVETFTSTAFSWAKTGAPHSYPEFPPIETYQKLIAEFAEASSMPA